jgi:hypothetical protein
MRKWASEWLDLPADVTEEVPRIEMIGSMRLQWKITGKWSDSIPRS